MGRKTIKIFMLMAALLLFGISAEARQYSFNALTGTGTGTSNTALDGWTISKLVDNDMAIGNVGGIIYVYYFDADIGTSESSPGVIVPNDQSSTGAWLIADITAGGIIHEDLTASTAVVTNGSKKLISSATTATQIGYLSDVTSLIQAQIDLKLNIANPLFTGTIGVGSAILNETEFEILDGANLSTTQLNYLNIAIGRSGDTNMAYTNNTTFSGTTVFDAITYNTLTGVASATPQQVFRDSGNPGTDKSIARIYAEFLSGGDGAEDGGLYLQARVAGSYETFLTMDADTNDVTTIKVLSGAIRKKELTAASYTVGTDDPNEAYQTYFYNTDDDALALTLIALSDSGCLENGQGVTAALTLTPPAGDYLVVESVRGTAATAYTSTGAAGDKICWVRQNADDITVTSKRGTWSE